MYTQWPVKGKGYSYDVFLLDILALILKERKFVKRSYILPLNQIFM